MNVNSLKNIINNKSEKIIVPNMNYDHPLYVFDNEGRFVCSVNNELELDAVKAQIHNRNDGKSYVITNIDFPTIKINENGGIYGLPYEYNFVEQMLIHIVGD